MKRGSVIVHRVPSQKLTNGISDLIAMRLERETPNFQIVGRETDFSKLESNRGICALALPAAGERRRKAEP